MFSIDEQIAHVCAVDALNITRIGDVLYLLNLEAYNVDCDNPEKQIQEDVTDTVRSLLLALNIASLAKRFQRCAGCGRIYASKVEDSSKGKAKAGEALRASDA